MINANEAKQTMLETIETAQAEAAIDQVIMKKEFKNNLLFGIEKRIKEDSTAGKSKSRFSRAVFIQQLKQIPFTPEANSGTDRIVDHFPEIRDLLIGLDFQVIVEANAVNRNDPDSVYIKWA